MPRTKQAKPETWVVSRGISLPRDVWEKVDAVADREDKPRSTVVGEAIALFLSVVVNSVNREVGNGNNREKEIVLSP